MSNKFAAWWTSTGAVLNLNACSGQTAIRWQPSLDNLPPTNAQLQKRLARIKTHTHTYHWVCNEIHCMCTCKLHVYDKKILYIYTHMYVYFCQCNSRFPATSTVYYTQCVWYGQHMAWSSLQMQEHTSGSVVLPHAIAATLTLLSYAIVGLMWSWLWNNTDKW